MNLVFESLNDVRLGEALALAKLVFPFNADKIEAAYRRSLDPERAYLDVRRLLEYSVVIDQTTGKIVGVTGLYNHREHPEDEAWLGWFCTDPSVRGRGVGRKILEWTMNRAQELGYKKFKLYTSTDPNEAVAQNLYESVGLMIYKREQSEEFKDEEILYRGKDL